MAFKIGDKIEVYRRQERNGFPTVESGFKGTVTSIANSKYYGKYAVVRNNSGDYWGIKLTYLKHIKE